MPLKIAEGRTAEVYAWEPGKVLKLFYAWFPSHSVEREASLANRVREAGIPTPAVTETVEIDERRGLVYERVMGVSMLDAMNARPWRLIHYARLLAELQARINHLVIPGLPTYRSELEGAIRRTPHLTGPLQEAALSTLAALPDGEAVCHGDFHPGNVLITADGPVVIDWMTARSGDIHADAARTSLILTIGIRGAMSMLSPVMRLGTHLYYREYLAHYQALIPDPQGQMERWYPVMAAARLYEGILPERAALLGVVEKAFGD